MRLALISLLMAAAFPAAPSLAEGEVVEVLLEGRAHYGWLNTFLFPDPLPLGCYLAFPKSPGIDGTLLLNAFVTGDGDVRAITWTFHGDKDGKPCVVSRPCLGLPGPAGWYVSCLTTASLSGRFRLSPVGDGSYEFTWGASDILTEVEYVWAVVR